MPFDLADPVLSFVRSSPRSVVKPWGHEVFIDNGAFIVKSIHIKDGHRTSQQYHKVKDEVIYICDGTGCVVLDGKAFYTHGLAISIPHGFVHRSIGPLVLLEVTTCDNDDVVRVEDDYGR